MMAMALGGRWRSEESESAEFEPSKSLQAEESEPSSDAVAVEASEAEIVEPSEVRTEGDSWKS